MVKDVVPRYIYPKNGEFPNRKRETLWGVQRFCPSKNYKRLVICEGIFDAVQRNNRVALLGSTISKEQIDVLKMIRTEETIVLLDGDAYEKAVAVAVALNRPHTWVAPMRQGSDPEDDKEVQRALRRKERIR